MKKCMMSLLILVVVLSVSAPVNAENIFTSGDYSCVLNDTGVAIIKYNGDPEEGSTLVIPDRIEGRPVTEIATYAFYIKKFSAVKIPETVSTIDSQAFYVCSNLTSVNIPSSVTEIDGNPFYASSALSQIDISADHPVFEEKEGALFQKKELKLVCYPAGLREEVYAVPEDTISIGEYAFAGNTNLVEVKIPDTVTEIGENAFFRCFSLRHLEIPASVTDIMVNPFASCTALTELSVSAENPFYSIIDGALIDNRDSKLISVPIISEDGIYTVPDPVIKIGAAALIQNQGLKIIKMNSQISEIGERAFFYCSNLRKVVLPDSLERIGENAFFNCMCLKDIIIPQNVKTIDSGAFKYCEGMNLIRIYSGVEEIGENAFQGCEELIFEVESGSYAENYALENGFEVRIIP